MNSEPTSPAPKTDAVSEPESEGHVVTVARSRGRRDGSSNSEGSPRRGLLLVVPLVGAAAAIVALVLTGMKDNAIYSKPVDELVAQKERFLGRSVRVEGNLVHGSLVKRDQPCEYRFVIEKNGVQLPVRYPQCVVPDTFRDVPGMDVGVTAEGQIARDGTATAFEASNVLAKCPSKYEMKDRASKGEQMPHGDMATAPSPEPGSTYARP